MSVLRSALFTASCVALFGAASTEARADFVMGDSVTYTYEGAAYGYDSSTINIMGGNPSLTGATLANGAQVSQSGRTSFDVLDGADLLQATDTTNGSSASLVAWCVDILHYTGSGSFTIGDVSHLSDGVTLDAARTNEIAALVVNGTNDLAAGITGGASKQQFSAAIQLAIWTVAYQSAKNDTGYDAGSTAADFYLSNATSGDIALADTFLTDVTNGSWTTNGETVYQLDNVAGQGDQQLVFAQASKVPEPASIALFGAGFLGLGLTRRFRRR